MSVQAETTGGIGVVTLGLSALDVTTAKEFKREMGPLLKAHRRMVLDFGQVTFVDSSGLGAILSCLRELNNSGGDLKLCNVLPPVRALFEMVRLHRIVDILATREDALASWR
ncbi:MAG TPA: STAS domain-containing protein [Gemmatimonadales bacterium]